LKRQWCIPTASATYVWRMEDVLDVYTRPCDPRRPVICLDEHRLAFRGETRPPEPSAPGKIARQDSEYTRHGGANVFVCYAPLLHWRQLRVTERRTKVDFAACIQQLVDACFPAAERIVLVMDNLNTHSPASLYEAFDPQEAKRLADKLEIHYTPTHGSWLNMAEIELSVLDRQCLNRRIPDLATLEHEVAVWEAERNASNASIEWRFTTADARIKLDRLYPTIRA
jgi:hypothetical protein